MLIRFFISFVIFMVVSVNGQSPVEIKIEVTGENIFTSPVQEPGLTLGLNPESTVGPPVDGMDETRFPGANPGADEVFFFISDMVQADTLVKDVKPYLANLVWQIRVAFGSLVSPPPGRDIELSWGDTNGTSLFRGLPYHSIQLKDGDTEVNMLNTATYTINGNSGDDPRDIMIELNNPSPTAENDMGVVLKNGSVILNVLENDSDPHNDDLTIDEILQQPQTGTAIKIDNDKKIEYIHSGDSLDDVTFSYTVSDGISSASATVKVLVQEVTLARNHPDIVVPHDGMDVMIQIHYAEAAKDQPLTLIETLPAFDHDPASFYSIPTGGGSNGLEISGNQPNSAFVNGAEVTLSWDPNITAFPPSPISLTYRIIGDENDRQSKSIYGELFQGTAMIGPVVETVFLPVESLFHPADSNQNQKISTLEKNIFFAIPTAIVKKGFQRCGNQSLGFPYTFEENSFRPCPDIGADCSACGTSQLHSADLDENQKINALEKNIFFAIPTAIVKTGFQRCGNQAEGYPYTFNGSNFIPENSAPCN